MLCQQKDPSTKPQPAISAKFQAAATQLEPLTIKRIVHAKDDSAVKVFPRSSASK